MDNYLHLKASSEKKYQELIREANKPDQRIPCREDPDKWDGWDRDGVPIPTPTEAKEWCADCPVLELCRDFARTERPAIGVYGGELYGAGVVKAERAGITKW